MQPATKTPTTAAPCRENWLCGDWSICASGLQNRSCADDNHCGTFVLAPAMSQACRAGLPENDTESGTGVNPPGLQCNQSGAPCQHASDCCGRCIHNVCRDGPTFCGDTYCDRGENCTTCSQDCGSCPATNAQRALEQNVFERPLGISEANNLKADGYVVVRYFYSPDCKFCYYPTDIEQQLKWLAGELKDLFVLEIINTNTYKDEASAYGSVGNTIYKPSIRIEGISNGAHGYDFLFGGAISNMLMDNDITADVAPLICKHSDYCDFSGGKVVRTTP